RTGALSRPGTLARLRAHHRLCEARRLRRALRAEIATFAPRQRMLIVESRPRQFEELLNRSHFAFTHNLSGHALFELPRLAALCEKVPAKRATIYRSDAGSPRGRPKVFTDEWKRADLIASLAGGTTRVSLGNVEACDDEYMRLHRQI